MSDRQTPDEIRPDSESSPGPAADTERPLRPSDLQLYRLKQAENDDGASVSADLFSALIRLPPILPPQHGKPSCIALQARFVAIGTTIGSVIMSPLAGVPTAMIFDSDQSRRYGAVSAADLTSSGSHLFVGHENGTLVLWDVVSKTTIKSVTGMHMNPVTCLRAVASLSIAVVSVDVKGVSMLTMFNKHIIGWSVSKAPVQKDLGQITSTAVSGTLCAFISAFKDLAVYELSGTRPTHLSRLPLPSMCSCLAWGGQSEQILAVEQHGAIVTFQIRDRQLMQLQKISLSKSPLTMMAFLNASCIAFICENELAALDIKSLTRLQTMNIAGVGIATHDKYDHPTTLQSVLSSDHAIQIVPNASLVLLAANGAVYQIAMLNPLYRIRVLTESGRWLEALSLALDLYQAGDDIEERSLLTSRLRTLILSYLKANTAGDMEAVYANVFYYCISFNNVEFLFDDVFKHSSGHRTSYLNAVLDAVESSSEVRRVPLRVITECVSNFSGSPRLERCLSVLEPTDIDKLRPICVQNRLWSALFSLCQRAQLPPSVPSRDLLSSVEEGDPAEWHAVRHLKRALSASSAVEDQQDVLAYLFSSDPPVLRRLLLHYASELIPVIGEMLLLDIWATTSGRPLTPKQSVLAGFISKTEKPASFRVTRDAAVDALLSAMVNARDSVTCRYGWAIPGPQDPFTNDELLILTRALSKPLGEGVILVSPLFLRLVIFQLLSARDQETILRAIVARLPPDRELLSMMLVAARTVDYRFLTIDLYKISGDIINSLDAFLACPEPDVTVFDYLISSLRETNASSLREEVLARIKPMVAVNGAHTAALLMEFYRDVVYDVIKSLAEFPELQFPFLQGLLEIPEFEASPEINETYIRLICKFDPKQVLPYIKSHYEYSMENVLAICQQCNIVDAVCFLLERTGDIDGALNLMLNSLDPLLAVLREEAKSRSVDRHHRVRQSDLELLPSAPELKHAVADLYSLCQRHSQFSENERRWLLVLDCLVKRRNSESDPLVGFALVESIQGTLAAMRGYVPLSSILMQIISDHCDSVYVEFRETILSLIETLAYDADMLRLCNAIMTESNNLSVIKMCNMMAKPIVSTASCSVCGCPLDRSDHILFVCGHACHQSCTAHNACHLCFRPTHLSQPRRVADSVQLP